MAKVKLSEVNAYCNGIARDLLFVKAACQSFVSRATPYAAGDELDLDKAEVKQAAQEVDKNVRETAERTKASPGMTDARKADIDSQLARFPALWKDNIKVDVGGGAAETAAEKAAREAKEAADKKAAAKAAEKGKTSGFRVILEAGAMIPFSSQGYTSEASQGATKDETNIDPKDRSLTDFDAGFFIRARAVGRVIKTSDVRMDGLYIHGGLVFHDLIAAKIRDSMGNLEVTNAHLIGLSAEGGVSYVYDIADTGFGIEPELMFRIGVVEGPTKPIRLDRSGDWLGGTNAGNGTERVRWPGIGINPGLTIGYYSETGDNSIGLHVGFLYVPGIFATSIDPPNGDPNSTTDLFGLDPQFEISVRGGW